MAGFSAFWSNVDLLTAVLAQETRVQSQQECCRSSPFDTELDATFPSLRAAGGGKELTLAKIEQVTEGLVHQLSQDEAPCLSYTSRNTWSNVRFEEGHGLLMAADGSQTTTKFDAIQSVNKFALTMKIMSLMYKLIQTDAYCTKRDLYYRDPAMFGSQAQVDDTVDNISCMLQVPRWHLHVMATSKGLLAGDLQYTDMDNTRVDCSLTNTGVMVPNHVQSVKDVESSAKFILVVEKDATFQSLLDDCICQRLAPCIMITGKGFPDMNTRLMLRRLWDTLHIPVLALVDADPHGVEILSVYRFGSKSLSFESEHLTVPAVRWLGILPSDITRFGVPERALIPLTPCDNDKGQDMLKRPYFASQPIWSKELETMMRSGRKAEIQSLASISENFLSQVYLPNKIRTGGWI